MKPSPELVEAARQAFYNNKGDDADCPFELMLQSLQKHGHIRILGPALDLAPSAYEAKVLAAWKDCDPEYGYLSFRLAARRSGLPEHTIRRAVRALARKGYLRFATGLFSDEGDMRGAGYGLTDRGWAWMRSNHPDNGGISP